MINKKYDMHCNRAKNNIKMHCDRAENMIKMHCNSENICTFAKKIFS
jgi:hypothetical protein